MAGYTKDQLTLFYGKAAKLNARRRSAFIHDIRSAVWATSKELKEVMKLFDKIEKS
jgi:hypothetical protein